MSTDATAAFVGIRIQGGLLPADLLATVKGAREQHDADALMHLWLYAFDNWVTDPRQLTID